MFSTFPEPIVGLIGRIPNILLTFKRTIISCFHLIGHTRTNVPDMVKKIFRFHANMPFPSHIGSVTSIAHQLWPETALIHRLLFLLGIPEMTPRHHHIPASDTNRAIPATRIIGVSELGPRAEQFIQIRSHHFGHAKRSDRLIGHIISKNKQDVWLLRR